MGQEIAIQHQGSTALASATPFSLTSLMALVPDWLHRGLFEDDHFALPQVIPTGARSNCAMSPSGSVTA